MSNGDLLLPFVTFAHHKEWVFHPSLFSGEGWDATIATRRKREASAPRNLPTHFREFQFAAKPR
jgi:hypothetical protein